MDDVAHSKPRWRWLVLALFVVFVLFTWWLTAATWIHTPSARGQHPVAAIVQWLLSPILAGILAVWWYTGRRALGKGLLTCAGAGLLVSLVNFTFIAIWPNTIYPAEPGPDSPNIDVDIPIVFGLANALLGALAGGAYFGLTRLTRGRSQR